MVKKYGKGLTQLLENIKDASVSVAPKEVLEGTRVYDLEIEKIFPNKNQPRKYFGEEEQKELEASIKVHGILQPLILVKKDEDKYMIVAGERRYRAARAQNFKTVPAIIKEGLGDDMIREISLIENLQRENLNAIEEAEALQDLATLNGYTQEQLAARIGKARSSVANTLRLLQLNEEVKSLVTQDRLSAGHARALIPITNEEDQIDFAYEAADGQMTVRELEHKVRVYLNPPPEKPQMSKEKKVKLTLELKNLVNDMKHVFMTKVKVVGNDNKGRIVIDYFSRDDLDRIAEIIESLKNKPE
ncbi:MAG TPA: ParB/RepB/Spo0J family partition protein [Clostridiales bacterium]|nr:ParB/RepB/Spo0J family partition protein [Clostridiales bacterium]